MKRKKGTGSVYKRKGSPVWWIKYHRHGRPFRESTHTTDSRMAERMLRTRLAEINQGTFVGPLLERTKVDDLATMFVRDYRINGRKSLTDAEARWNHHLKPFFGSMRAVDVTSEQLARYVDKRQQEQAANATINRELAALKTDVPAWAAIDPTKSSSCAKISQTRREQHPQGILGRRPVSQADRVLSRPLVSLPRRMWTYIRLARFGIAYDARQSGGRISACDSA